VSDGTGMHPTRTTFATTVVESSLAFGDETVMPTPASYHHVELDTDVRIFNSAVGDGLTFSDTRETWSNYNQHQDEYANSTWDTGATRLHPWVEGFSTRYSWDYKSPLTSNEYVNLCPTLIYHDGSRTQYYFFREVFDDFQAYHGFANWSRKKDGFPGPDWPGMIKVVRSIAGLSQRPKRRSEYEEWFGTQYGNGFSYAAPYMHLLSKMPLVPPPTRFRYADPTREPKDVIENFVADISPYKLADLLDKLPTFTPGTVTVPSAINGQNYTTSGSVTGMDYSRPWTLALPNMDVTTYSMVGSSGLKTLAAAQVSPAKYIVYNTSDYVGMSDITAYNLRTGANVYSGWIRPGAPTELCGWVVTTRTSANASPVAVLVTTTYGVTSLSPTASLPGGSTKYLLQSSSVQSEILSNMAVHPNACPTLGFKYDGSIGAYGEVTWLSQI